MKSTDDDEDFTDWEGAKAEAIKRVLEDDFVEMDRYSIKTMIKLMDMEGLPMDRYPRNKKRT